MGFLAEIIVALVLVLAVINYEQLDVFKKSDQNASAGWKCNHLDTTLLKFSLGNELKLPSSSTIRVLYQYDLCENCDLIDLYKFNANNSTENQITIDSYYSYDFEVELLVLNQSSTTSICDEFNYSDFVECGQYNLIIEDFKRCRIEKLDFTDDRSFFSKNPLILGIPLVVLFILVTNNIGFLSKSIQNNNTKSSGRLESLDTFRGFSLFLMIFVNYGSGGYKFLQHAPWHGITLADFVFPWFLWIMGFSIPLSTNSLLSRADSKKSVLFWKILERSAKMFFIGIMLNSRFGVELGNLRFFGVFQRIALTYFFVAILELILHRNSVKSYHASNVFVDLIWSRIHLFVMFLLTATWHFLIFKVQVPGCPVGYIGPGGLHNNSTHFNCTGGATGYIDQILFGKTHLYNWPTPKKLYQTSEPFDPEGFLGTFNAIVLTYTGVQAGRALIFHKDNKPRHLIIWISWSFICLFGYAVANQWAPVNKNLWTFSFTLITSSSSFFLLALFYYIIDVKMWWSGRPFTFLGKNSLLIYICHVLFSKMLPIYFVASHTHLSQLLMNIWGSIWWTLVSIYLYLNRRFVNL
jgi:heparan-alpha-glucosaminide N-acetyltransferase